MSAPELNYSSHRGSSATSARQLSGQAHWPDSTEARTLTRHLHAGEHRNGDGRASRFAVWGAFDVVNDVEPKNGGATTLGDRS